jgi:hypothetical protein
MTGNVINHPSPTRIVHLQTSQRYREAKPQGKGRIQAIGNYPKNGQAYCRLVHGQQVAPARVM